MLLAELERGETPSAETILAEVMALRIIFLNAIAAIGRGQELTTEQMQKLIERADADKFRKVAERVEQQKARKKPQRKEASGNGRG